MAYEKCWTALENSPEVGSWADQIQFSGLRVKVLGKGRGRSWQGLTLQPLGHRDTALWFMFGIFTRQRFPVFYTPREMTFVAQQF